MGYRAAERPAPEEVNVIHGRITIQTTDIRAIMRHYRNVCISGIKRGMGPGRTAHRDAPAQSDSSPATSQPVPVCYERSFDHHTVKGLFLVHAGRKRLNTGMRYLAFQSLH